MLLQITADKFIPLNHINLTQEKINSYTSSYPPIFEEHTKEKDELFAFFDDMYNCPLALTAKEAFRKTNIKVGERYIRDEETGLLLAELKTPYTFQRFLIDLLKAKDQEPNIIIRKINLTLKKLKE